MPQPSKGPRLGGSPSHERLILANLATALFEHGRITTTESRAKRLKPVAERLVTIAKKGEGEIPGLTGSSFMSFLHVVCCRLTRSGLADVSKPRRLLFT
mgnify:CR=1 FL=1